MERDRLGTLHKPVMVEEVIQALLFPLCERKHMLPKRYWMIDGTLGEGGHLSAFLAFAKEKGLDGVRFFALDQDPDMIAKGKNRFKKIATEKKLIFQQGNFKDLSTWKTVFSKEPVFGILVDLGWNLAQMKDSKRGLSVYSDDLLDMRYNPRCGLPLWRKLQDVSFQELEKVLQVYGQVQPARRIVRAILEARKNKALPLSCRQFANWVQAQLPAWMCKGRIHPATKVFQAFRIWVNQEWEALQLFLKQSPDLLAEHGRMAVLSFHSGEDRIVKHAFREKVQTGACQPGAFQLVFKKPKVPSRLEQKKNRSSRSAKLRVLEKL